MAGENLKAALEAAPANSRITLQKGATFDINAPINLVNSGVVIDAQGATLRIGSAASGGTATADQMINFTGFDQRLQDAIFGPRVSGTNATFGANVTFNGGGRNEIRDCTFNTRSSSAVQVRGGNEHRVVGNYLSGSDIGYSVSGVCRTYVANNTIINSPQNSLSGSGDATGSSFFNDDCMVIDNIIINAGRMGIEDIAQSRRTLIRGNRIYNSRDIAISAVGIAPIIQGNVIIFSTTANCGIECTSDGGNISGNTINFQIAAGYTGAGVTINGCRFLSQAGVTVTGNMINNPYYGIGINAGISTAMISNNVITNPVQQAFGLNPVSAEAIVCSGNQIRISVPSSMGTRDGISVGACSNVTLTGNNISYTAGSAGGSATERPIRLMANNTLMTGNSVNGGGRTDANRPVVSSSGAAPSGLVITANQFRAGATLNVTGMVSPVVASNGGY